MAANSHIRTAVAGHKALGEHESQGVSSVIEAAHRKKVKTGKRVSFAPGPLEHLASNDGHPQEGRIIQRARVVVLPRTEPLTLRHISMLEKELEPECAPSIERLKRRAGLAPLVKRHLPYAGAPSSTKPLSATEIPIPHLPPPHPTGLPQPDCRATSNAGVQILPNRQPHTTAAAGAEGELKRRGAAAAAAKGSKGKSACCSANDAVVEATAHSAQCQDTAARSSHRKRDMKGTAGDAAPQQQQQGCTSRHTGARNQQALRTCRAAGP